MQRLWGLFKKRSSKPDEESAPRGKTPGESDKPEPDSSTSRAEGWLQPSSSVTRNQLLRLCVLDGMGGALFSACINFVIAYVMYKTQPRNSPPVRLFRLPNSLAGDATVTIFAQCILLWFVKLMSVSYDLGRRAVQPMGFVKEPAGKPMRRLMFLPEQRGSKIEAAGVRSVMAVVHHVLRSLLLASVVFLVLWPASIGILVNLGEPDQGDRTYERLWTPQIFKAVFGGLLGLLTTPTMTIFWLVRAGWEAKRGRLTS
ncbi:uncharacterized protein UV8b_07148 [Ustilaginoidea virens]|uniref:Uncharacterized protein n=1 Tax=Ustilaginoidea virens TaxID=1159556 RepID=A0A8E5MK93_USTVR|nr:uncharacterized protein UV8b_07148 [Ustilaginoidea virens]QUC22907.1 hypothetical protein UV8b_07148 [Ustilaginoidea virens]